MKSLVVIPARGGSKGVPGKNIKPLQGKPLIHYTIEAALSCFDKDRIIVSTDSKQIKATSEECGIKVPFLRPNELATDEASSYEVIRHAMKYANESGIDFDAVVLLQPTSPFRNSKHIEEALSLYNTDLDMVVSVNESSANPYYNLFEENSSGLLTKSKKGDFTRRQDCPPVYEYNGAIYIMNRTSLEKASISDFKNIKKYVMSSESSHDIDTQLDWIIAEAIIKK
jgi:N-acylneuraminate cytidylyltransferase